MKKLSTSKKPKKQLLDNRSIEERKASFLGCSRGRNRQKKLKKYYKHSGLLFRFRFLRLLNNLAAKNIRFFPLNFLRWVIIDALRGRVRRPFGIYQYVALPGEGKTLSMVAHMERFRKDMRERHLKYVIATNFNYVHQDQAINHWLDIVRISKDCYMAGIPCLIAMDEIHITWDSAEWKDFPPEMLAVLSFNRKYQLEFICSSQIYERIPKKIRDIANYTVVCKNVLHLDRWFKNYYFTKDDYESQFDGKKKKSKFTRSFIASDDMYNLYDTLQQVDRLAEKAKAEANKREEAFRLLFGSPGQDGE